MTQPSGDTWFVSGQRGDKLHFGQESYTLSEAEKIAIDRAIRHLPIVNRTIEEKALETADRAGPGFAVELITDKKTTRTRAWIGPITSDAIHAELSDAALIKAMLSMQGK